MSRIEELDKIISQSSSIWKTTTDKETKDKAAEEWKVAFNEKYWLEHPKTEIQCRK